MAYIQRLRRGGLSFAREIYPFNLPESPAKTLLNISLLRSALPEKALTFSALANLMLTRHPPGTGCKCHSKPMGTTGSCHFHTTGFSLTGRVEHLCVWV